MDSFGQGHDLVQFIFLEFVRVALTEEEGLQRKRVEAWAGDLRPDRRQGLAKGASAGHPLLLIFRPHFHSCWGDSGAVKRPGWRHHLSQANGKDG